MIAILRSGKKQPRQVLEGVGREVGYSVER